MDAQRTNIDNRRSAIIAAQRKIAGDSVARSAAGWLGLAAAPTFAIMALLTGVLGGPANMMCSAAPSASPLNGMVLMYLLMGVFHSAPWLTVISNRRRGALRL
jgi:uncharacterized membrane protein